MKPIILYDGRLEQKTDSKDSGRLLNQIFSRVQAQLNSEITAAACSTIVNVDGPLKPGTLVQSGANGTAQVADAASSIPASDVVIRTIGPTQAEIAPWAVLDVPIGNAQGQTLQRLYLGNNGTTTARQPLSASFIQEVGNIKAFNSQTGLYTCFFSPGIIAYNPAAAGGASLNQALTPSTGLTGSAYNGSIARTWTVNASYILGLFSATAPITYSNTTGVIALTTPVATTYGGTGLASLTQGDLLYYNTGTLLSKLAKDTNATRYLSNQGTSNNPSWNQVDLTNGVTGTLPAANGGTGATAVGNYTATAPIVLSATRQLIGGAAVVSMPVATNSVDGYLSAADHTTFSAAAAGGITALTGQVTATGPGSVAATIAANTVSNSNIRQSGALTVIGRASNSTGNVADITANFDGQVLVRGGTALSFNSIDLANTGSISGILPIGNGGTGSAIVSPSSGKILQSNGTVFVASGATWPTAATSLKLIIGNGTNYVESTPAYPNASATSGKIIVSDGTNYIASTPTYPNATPTLGQFIISDSANWVASTLIVPNAAATGDILYASSSNTMSRLPDVATGNALISGGVTTAPLWGKIGLTTHVTGTLPVANGGTNAGAFTAGSVVFAGASGTYTQDNASLFFDDTNNRLGIGTASPAQLLTLNSTTVPYQQFSVSGTAKFYIGASASTDGLITGSVSGDGMLRTQGGSFLLSVDSGSTAALTVGTNGNLNLNYGFKWHRTATATSYTALATDAIIGVTSTASARTITLYAANAVAAGTILIIKDESGAAATNAITIARAGSDTIDGATSKVINTNYGSVTIYSNGSAAFFTI